MSDIKYYEDYNLFYIKYINPEIHIEVSAPTLSECSNKAMDILDKKMGSIREQIDMLEQSYSELKKIRFKIKVNL